MPKHPAETLLGFDFGTKKIGVALGQTITQDARPLAAIPATNGIPDWPALEVLFEQWSPDACVVGAPIAGPEGDASYIACAARKFANRLQARFNLPVHQVNEHLTTHWARDYQKRFPEHSLDAIAATFILEQWLQSARRTAPDA